MAVFVPVLPITPDNKFLFLRYHILTEKVLEKSNLNFFI